MARQTDVFYGLCTFWTDDWASLGRTREGIPCCPYCGAVGFEMDRKEWLRQIAAHEAKGNPDYLAMMRWAKDRCFSDFATLTRTYRANRDGTNALTKALEDARCLAADEAARGGPDAD